MTEDRSHAAIMPARLNSRSDGPACQNASEGGFTGLPFWKNEHGETAHKHGE